MSLLEHGVYRQLIDMYYLNESPLTADLNQLCRKLCARNQEEKDSVEIILNEFFQLTDSGWSHKRCDEEIEDYSIQNEDNRAREDNEKERMRRHRDERKRLFAELREKGQIPKWDIAIDQLRDLHKQYCNQSLTLKEHTCNAPVTEQEHFCNAPATAITKEPINQQPVTNNHKPIKPKDLTYGVSGSNEPSTPSVPEGVKISLNPVQKIKTAIKNNNKDLSPSHETWQAYSDAYEKRHGAKPVRNATVNAQIIQFIKRIGYEESPHVAEFYVYHNNAFYVQKMHTVGLLLADAEKLRTEWVTKKTMTNTQARQADRKQNTANVFNQLIEENRAKANVTTI